MTELPHQHASWRIRSLFLRAVVSAVLVAGATGQAPAAAAAGETAAVLTQVAEVRRLVPTEAQAGHPVRIEGVVTFSDSDSPLLFVQDASGGCFVAPRAGQAFPSFGQRVRIEGTAEAGSNLPFINHATVRMLGSTGLPATRQVPVEEMAAGKWDCEWVETTAVVRAMRRGAGRSDLFLRGAQGPVRVHIRESSAGRLDWSRLEGATVRLYGVGGVDMAGTNVAGGVLYLQRSSQVTITSPGPVDVFDCPLLPLADALQRDPGDDRIRVRGELRRQAGTDRLVVRDTQERQIAIEATDSVRLRDGAMVEVSGFTARRNDRRVLEYARVRLLGPPANPPGAPPDILADLARWIPVLTDIPEVRRLSRPAANRQLPLRLEGVLTYADTNHGDAFLCDGVNSIYLYALQSETPLRPGLAGEVAGVTDAGAFAPIVMNGRFTASRQEGWPLPRKVQFTELAGGGLDAQWVELDVVLRSFFEWDGRWFCQAGSDGGIVLLTVPVETGSAGPAALIDARLRVRANVGAKIKSKASPDSQPVGATLFVPGLAAVSVLEPPPADPFVAPRRSIASLSEFNTEGQDQHRVRVAGVVTWTRAGQELTLQDETDAILIRTADPTPLAIGDRAEVVGFTAQNPTDLDVRLEAALLRREATGATIQPLTVPPGQLTNPTNNCRVVTVNGTAVAAVDQAGQRLLHLESEGRFFVAELAATAGAGVLPAAPRPGSVLQLTGVLRLTPGAASPYDAVRLQLRTPADVTVLSRPAWWSWRHTGIAAGALALLGLAAAAWIATLRREVAAQARVLREQHDKEAALEARLRQSQKMESLGQLAGGVAHDFNNLLQVIQGNTELATLELPHDHPAAAPLGEVQRASQRAASIVRQLLTFSRRAPRRLAPVDVNRVIADLSSMLGRLIDAPVELEVRTTDPLPPVQADRGQLEQVIVNLCLNARDAMPAGGRIIITTHVVSPEAVPASLAGGPSAASYVGVSVQDSGAGIPPELQQRIFEPFFTTKEVGKGTGLGLSTAYAIAKDHGGTIEVQSRAGAGANFTVYLPVSDLASTTPAATVPPSQERRGHGEIILLVEDEEAVRGFAQRVLVKAGYQVLAAADGHEALQLLESRNGRFDLALLDVVMPRRGGGDVYHAVRARWPGIPCLFMSGYSHEGLHKAGLDPDQVELLLKPFSPEGLLQAIHQALAGRRQPVPTNA